MGKTNIVIPKPLMKQLEGMPKGFIAMWLRKMDLTGPLTDVLYSKLEQYVASENVSIDDLGELVEEFESYGKKRVFLFKFHSSDRKKIGKIDTLEESAATHPAIGRNRSGISLKKQFDMNGFTFTDLREDELGQSIHIQCEYQTVVITVHKDQVKVIGGKTYVPADQHEVIVKIFVDVHVKHGLIELRFDSIAGIGPCHKLKDQIIDGVRGLLGLGVPVLATNAKTGDALRNANIGDFKDVTRKYEHTDEGGKTVAGIFRVQTNGRDVSSMPGADEVIIAGDADSYFRRFKIRWRPTASGGNLQRHISFVMNVDTGEIRFETECFRTEMDYVLSRIRTAS